MLVFGYATPTERGESRNHAGIGKEREPMTGGKHHVSLSTDSEADHPTIRVIHNHAPE